MNAIAVALVNLRKEIAINIAERAMGAIPYSTISSPQEIEELRQDLDDLSRAMVTVDFALRIWAGMSWAGLASLRGYELPDSAREAPSRMWFDVPSRQALHKQYGSVVEALIAEAQLPTDQRHFGSALGLRTTLLSEASFDTDLRRDWRLMDGDEIDEYLMEDAQRWTELRATPGKWWWPRSAAED